MDSKLLKPRPSDQYLPQDGFKVKHRSILENIKKFYLKKCNTMFFLSCSILLILLCINILTSSYSQIKVTVTVHFLHIIMYTGSLFYNFVIFNTFGSKIIVIQVSRCFLDYDVQKSKLFSMLFNLLSNHGI